MLTPPEVPSVPESVPTVGVTDDIDPMFRKRFFGGLIFLCYVAATLASIIAALGPAILLGLSGPVGDLSSNDKALINIAALMGLWIGFVGGPITLSLWAGTGNIFRDFRIAFRWIDIPVGIGFAIVAQIASVLVTLPFAANKEISDNLNKVNENLLPGNGLLKIIIVLFVVVFVPFVEELFFRGLLFRYVRFRMKRVVSAMVVSGVIFALVHATNAPSLPSAGVLVLALIPVGITFCVAENVYDRLGTSVIAHGTFNGITTAIQLGLVLPFYLRHA